MGSKLQEFKAAYLLELVDVLRRDHGADLPRGVVHPNQAHVLGGAGGGLGVGFLPGGYRCCHRRRHRLLRLDALGRWQAADGPRRGLLLRDVHPLHGNVEGAAAALVRREELAHLAEELVVMVVVMVKKWKLESSVSKRKDSFSLLTVSLFVMSMMPWRYLN